jgi:hypothetical protein
MRTLYTSLARRVPVDADADPARTEFTFDDRETIDRDRAQSSLYSQLSIGIAPDQRDAGRTEVTRADSETVDRDRHAPHGRSALFGAGDDLYCALATWVPASTGDQGRTALTESTESIDWDRPPIGPWT